MPTSSTQSNGLSLNHTKKLKMPSAPRHSPHHHIVFLQADYLPVPKFDLPVSQYTTTIYQQTSPSELHERIHDASVLVHSNVKLDATALSPEITPQLKLIAVAATGTDSVDLEACRKRGIVVSRCPGANVDAVSEHAIGLYFTARRRILDMHMLTWAGEWPKKGTLMPHILDKDGQPPLTCQEEVVGIIGNGVVGKRIAHLARNLGMKVLISARKEPNDSLSLQNGNGEERISFSAIIKQSTVLFIAVPLSQSTRNLISTSEFEAMSPHTILVNVSRGGVVDEEALLQALRKGGIAGAATDVFREEPASPENSPLLADGAENLHLITTPHLAWLSQRTVLNYSQMVKEAIEGWRAGQPCNTVT